MSLFFHILGLGAGSLVPPSHGLGFRTHILAVPPLSGMLAHFTACWPGRGLQTEISCPCPEENCPLGNTADPGHWFALKQDKPWHATAVHKLQSEKDCISIALLSCFLAMLSITKCMRDRTAISPHLCVCVCAIIFLLCQKAKPACEEAINLSPCLMLLFCCIGLWRTCWKELLYCANAS